MKKKYISPQTVSHVLAPMLPIAGSKLDPNASGQQRITVTEQEVDEFTSRRRRDMWEDEEDEDF
jgi:hypothetical protein